jgi:hypothetical protein
MTLGRRELLGALLLALTACGSKAPGGGGGGNPPDGGSAGTPTAAFAAPTTVPAGTPALFDGSASHAADGSALSYFWEFGGGRRGSGGTIAQLFDEVGSRQISLTVVDAQGRSARVQHALEVTAGPAPAGTVSALGRIHDLDGHPLEDVTVAPGGGAAASTDALGQVHVQVPIGGPVTIRLSKAGFADQFLRLELPASTGADADFEATLRPRDTPQTLADAAAGGALDGRDGVRIVFPPGALVDGAGAAVSGPIDVSLTPVDVTAPHAGGFPGKFEGLGPDASDSPIVSLGTTEFVPSRAGDRLQLGLGKTVEIELPLYADTLLDGTPTAAGQTVPLWSLDESTGIWIQEGTGTVVASSASPTGLAMRATASHLSWWNADHYFNPFRPKPKCVYDTDIGLPGGEDQFNTATICNLLGEIDRGLGPGPLRGPSPRSPALAAPGPKYPGFAATLTIPIEGGIPVPVPAGVPVHLAANALNGTWTGETSVTGANGEIREVLIKMRPIGGAGAGELVTPPTDLTAALQGADVARYDFLGTTGQWAKVTVGPANDSTLQGHVRLLLGPVELAAADFGPGSPQILQRLPVDGRFTVEITPTANTPGAFEFQLELVGGLQTASLTLPFDATVQAPAFTTAREVFDLSTGQAVLLGFQTQDFQPVSWRLRSEGGASLAQGVVASQETHAVSVGGPGRFWLEMWNAAGRSLSVRVTGERTFWATVAATAPVTTSVYLADLVADNAGAPVLIRSSQAFVGGVMTQTVSLLRWDGTALTAVGPDLVYPNPCAGAGFQSMDVAFDTSNRPYVLYADTVDTASGPGRFNVRRLGSGGWEAVGPALPNQSPSHRGCYPRPSIRILPDQSPIVAYQGEGALWVQRLQGSAWVGLVSPNGDSFTEPAPEFELQLDPGGVPVLVRTPIESSGTAHVVRLSGTPSWDGVGPNGGTVPLPATIYNVQNPRLRFDAAGHPVLGLVADVVTGPGTGTTGITVASFDGASWHVADGYLGTTDVPTRGAEVDVGFTLFSGEPVMAWRTLLPPFSYEATTVERNTASGWSGLGPADGLVPQLSQDRGLVTDAAFSHRLLASGGALYLGVVVNGRSGTSVQLLRYAP